MRYIDNFLNSITMYRLVLYGLLIIAVLSVIFGFLGLLPYSGFSLLASLALFSGSCHAFSFLLAKLFKAPANYESSPITSLILFLIFPSVASGAAVITILLASAIAMSSKYLFAIHKKHIFNPAAISAVALGFSATTAASWWVGSSVLFPFTLILGLLIVRKIRRFDLFVSFVIASFITILAFGAKNNVPLGELAIDAFLSWPLIFFGTVMLTEPQTMPGKRPYRIAYAILVGLIFGSQWNIGPVYPTPELSLIIGNIFSYAVSFKRKLILKLRERKEIASGVYDLTFDTSIVPRFEPGQYLEWTLPPKYSDSRGNRRYFTISSSPTEGVLKLGVKVPAEKPSRFKQGLLELKEGESIAASQLTGDFVLPKDSNEKLVFIAGGIGITPFRSMLKFLLDTKDTRDIVLFYAVLSPSEIAYKEIFEEAERTGKVKVVYVLTGKDIPSDWNGQRGFITSEMVQAEVKDWNRRMYYLSGPQAMVTNYKKMLKGMGISNKHIRTDYFPGF